MTYGQQPGHGRPHGRRGPQGQPGYGQGSQPPYGAPPQYGSPQSYGQPQTYGPPQPYGAPQSYGGPQPYGAPQHQAPPDYGRPPRERQRPDQQNPYGPGQYGPPPGPHAAEAPRRGRRRAETPTGGPVFDEDERWAVPAYVGMFVSGFVAPAIVLAVKGRTSPFARFHAVQALNLFIAIFVCTVAAFVPAYVNGVTWLPLTLAVLAADCFLVVKAAIGANRCEWYRLPSILAWPIVH